MAKSESDDRNRDDQLKPGAPPRPASEPAGSKGSSDSAKTATDPATGEPNRGAPRPNQAG
jgi:hypothetical protein